MIENRMPKKETIRRYYKNSPLTDEVLVSLAEFVRSQQGSEGISMLSFPLKILVAWEETKLKETSNDTTPKQ